MSAFCPFPESLEDSVVHCAKGLLACHVPVKIGPSPDNGVELHNQIASGGLFVVFDDLADFRQKRQQVFLGGFDDEFAFELAYRLSEEVEAFFDVDDFCLFLGECQPSFQEKGFDDWQDFVFQQFWGCPKSNLGSP